MCADQKRKKMLDFGVTTWVIIKGVASIVLIYFAVRLCIGAITDGSTSETGPYILWGSAVLFTVGAAVGIYRFVRDAGILIRAKAKASENAKNKQTYK